MLGDAVYKALSSVGLTSARVERWLGGPCGCEERRQKLNQLSAWASRVLAGKTADAERWLSRIMEA